MTKRLRIGIDIDDVLFECFQAFCEYHNHYFGTEHHSDDIDDFNISILIGETVEETIRRVEEFYRTPFHDNMPLIENAVYAVALLSIRHDLFAITSRCEYNRELTEALLRKHNLDAFEEVHFVGNRGIEGITHRTKGDVADLLSLDFHIEDSSTNAKSVAAEGVPVLLFCKPWNQDDELDAHPNIHRVSGWTEAVDHIMKHLRS